MFEKEKNGDLIFLKWLLLMMLQSFRTGMNQSPDFQLNTVSRPNKVALPLQQPSPFKDLHSAGENTWRSLAQPSSFFPLTTLPTSPSRSEYNFSVIPFDHRRRTESLNGSFWGKNLTSPRAMWLTSCLRTFKTKSSKLYDKEKLGSCMHLPFLHLL